MLSFTVVLRRKSGSGCVRVADSGGQTPSVGGGYRGIIIAPLSFEYALAFSKGERVVCDVFQETRDLASPTALFSNGRIFVYKYCWIGGF